MDLNHDLHKPFDYYRKWRYRNTALLVASILLFFYFSGSPVVENALQRIGGLGYIGAFFTGVFFVSVFTFAPAAVLLFNFADTLDPFAVALLAGAGGLLGDYLIFRFLRHRVFDELKPIYRKFGGSQLNALFMTPYFSWLIPFAGALLIASPLPDELGVGLMGLSKIKDWQFILLSFLLNAVGIFVIVTAARAF